MRVAIVVPYSWSFWGGVVEHATEQAAALEQLGVETRILIGHDPPGAFSRTLHPRSGRSEQLPPNVVPLGHSVIVPGNGSLPNLVLSPLAIARLRRQLLHEDYDIVHVHEPLTPALGVGALAWSQAPIVSTFHAAGDSSWRPAATALWGFLLDRIDHHIAVSGAARDVAGGYHAAEYEILPNGIRVPERRTDEARNQHVAFVGRHEPRKGLPVLLQAWPTVRAQTGVTLRIIGADPLAVSLLIRRLRIDDDGIEIIGLVSDENLGEELASAQLLIAPSLGGESFGMVLTRAFACATPVVASDIDGYRELVTPDVGFLTPPGDPVALTHTVITALDEPGRLREAGRAARNIALTRYRWDTIARRLVEIYGTLVGGKPRNEPIQSAESPTPSR
jgi:phosphatidylinositol alpha-mannosyltransferase